MYQRPQTFSLLPPVIKNLLIINGLAFFGTMTLGSTFGYDLNREWGLYLPFVSPHFNPGQIITHMFLHGNFMHIFFNMFALWMFGSPLENLWGSKRFLIFYIVTGLGAALCHSGVNLWEYYNAVSHLTPDQLDLIKSEGQQVLNSMQNYSNPDMGLVNLLLNTPTVGASGAVFGVLLGYGMTFPNTYIYVYFMIPIKAKYFVIIYGLIELFSGISNSASNIAHFAHVGGMVFGYFLIRHWQRNQFRQF
ncbi:MAG: rhomboid family intramembrane serine protease [Bacteroidota bacterium]|nr:rhomboid family intramembrane serine protease [Bacteroidota bacterium]MDX5403945.1 rhomboid family intramembrane serine protease [Bacteroidota bacterium]MDX5426838.1 rhomboid family intramembrane serine protease [Bacteroidota bacterium]MDX5448600.1 rhomboid family intramembrane serine protease [Bacteroidota bacterium]MDX5504824.1 rhomboid family intramembrane serine protease [Bacteroidota bacterium]